MPSIEPLEAVAFAAILVAGFVQGLAGFGFALIVVPTLLLFLDPPSSVALTMVLAAIVCIPIILHTWRHIKTVESLLMLGATVPGVWVGTQALLIWPATAIKLLAGAAAVASSIPLLLGFRRRFSRERPAIVAGGFLSGFLQGSTGLSGPPIVLVLSNQGWDRDAFRANLSLFFTVSAVFTVVAIWLNGALRPEIMTRSVVLAPALMLGLLGGLWTAPRVKLARFQLIVALLVMLTGSAALISGLVGLTAVSGR